MGLTLELQAGLSDSHRETEPEPGRMPGERMWVMITHRNGDNLTGTLENWPVFAHLWPGETVTFHMTTSSTTALMTKRTRPSRWPEVELQPRSAHAATRRLLPPSRHLTRWAASDLPAACAWCCPRP